VLGDSVTSQIRDELVADTRYNWVVASLCGGRLDHFLGDPIGEQEPDLEFGLDAILAADPDVVVVALGSVDSKLPGVDHTANVNAMLDRLRGVRCPAWMNVYVGNTNPTWSEAARRFNSLVASASTARGAVQLDWAGGIAASGPTTGDHPWLAPGPFDQLHVTVPIGHQARVGMILSAVERCAAPPAPVTCISGMWDVWGDHPFCADIAWLAQAGITTAYPDFTFRPDLAVTRQAMAAFLHRLAGSPPLPAPGGEFTDVPADHPFGAEIGWLVDEGIAGGFTDGTFGPGRSVTRQAMAAFLYRMAGSPAFTPPLQPTFDDLAPGDPFYAEVEWLAAQGIASGFADGAFGRTRAVSRQAMAAFLHRFAAAGLG
jgi:hypothetical protein